MDVFVYGTLTDPERAASVLGAGGFAYRGDAVLDGLHHVAGTYPTLAPGGTAVGRLLRVDGASGTGGTGGIDVLDRYEGVERGLYVRVSVPLVDESGTVEIYVGDPDTLDVREPVEWPGSGAFGERVRRYVREHSVVVRRE
jgi:gamma-glutamylcyclotransferase (GGCT)/AIG2-like uncharacterized protein YtfP